MTRAAWVVRRKKLPAQAQVRAEGMRFPQVKAIDSQPYSDESNDRETRKGVGIQKGSTRVGNERK